MNTPEPFWQSADNLSRLYLGNAFDVMSSIPDESVDCVWTDPPYFLSNDGITCVAGRMVKVNKGEWDRSRGLESDHDFTRQWLAECHRILKPAGTIWVTGTVHVYLSVGMAMLQLGYRILNDIQWEKPNPPPNLGRRCFTHSTETLLWATKAKKGSKHRHTFNYDVMREENGGRQMKTVWTMPPPGRDEKRFGKHPTQKPLALIRRCLRASTHPGEIVFDPFVGSGSTGVAALGLGRRFWGAESLEEYANLSRVRLSDVDLKSAELSTTQLADTELRPTQLVDQFLKKYPELSPSDDISGNGADSDVPPTQVKMLEERKRYTDKAMEGGME